MVMLPLFLLILLTGCSVKQNSDCSPKIVNTITYKYNTIPDELLQCKDLNVSYLNITKQSQVARLLTDIVNSYYDCKLKLESIKKINNLNKEYNLNKKVKEDVR